MNNFNDFINYCLDFYGQGGLYDQGRTKEQIAYATTVYLDACAYYAEQDKPWTSDYKVMTWGNGDSLDRERVRDIMKLLRGKLMDDYTPNELAYLDLVNDISKIFCFVGGEDECAICDGDMKNLDKAVKRFKKTVWFNQLD